jgi:Asp-tRNA(Asn)/Glu-tRNA(Gln) amidotransferase C subunit
MELQLWSSISKQLNLLRFEFNSLAATSDTQKRQFASRKQDIVQMFSKILLDVDSLQKIKREKSSIDWLREDLVKELSQLKQKYIRNVKLLQDDICQLED